MTDPFADEPGARELAARLAHTLTESGDLTDPQWRRVFARVPRHAVVPHFARNAQKPEGTRYELVTSTNPAQHDEWLREVYTDTTLITQVDGEPVETRFTAGRGFGKHSSSSTKPGLMLRMLETLDIRDGHRVMEIGTGTGFNAMLLAERLGAELVTTIDIDAKLTHAASIRLAAAGYRPTFVRGDGRNGYAPNAPYDRVIATCSYPAVPARWIEQTTNGGLILTDLAGMIGGAMLLATVDGNGTAHGRFLPDWAGFMPSRHPRPADAGYSSDYTKSTTMLDPRALDNRAFAFTAQLYLPGVRKYWATDGEGHSMTGLHAPDGSWAEVHEPRSDGTRYLEQGGPRQLWSTLEEAHRFWKSAGQPDWTAFGFTATPERQEVRLTDRAWELPSIDGTSPAALTCV
jgi:methyltransferase of ATP-grasp peptide maturase system